MGRPGSFDRPLSMDLAWYASGFNIRVGDVCQLHTAGNIRRDPGGVGVSGDQSEVLGRLSKRDGDIKGRTGVVAR